MKKLVMGLALAAMATTPALAQSYESGGSRASATDPGYGPYAYSAPSVMSDAGGVYAYGHFQGNDPDSFIRGQLLRDPPSSTY